MVGGGAALEAALRAEVNGGVIKLAPGRYAGVAILNRKPGGVLVITSQDPGHPAVISGLTVSGSSNVEFSDLTMDVPLGANPFPNRVADSSHIVFANIKFHGAATAPPADNNTGVSITSSSKILVRNSSFVHLQNGVVELNNTGVRISENTFTQMGGDGIDNAGSSDVRIDRNSFSNFQNGNGIHPDAIQFWTTGTTASVSNIEVSNNTMSRGKGSPFQGIFMTDQVGGLSYANVVISDNTAIGCMYNGITLEHGVNAVIAGNTVIGFADMQSWIRIEDGKKLTLTNNQSQDIVFARQAKAEVSASGNGVPIDLTSPSQGFYSNLAPLATTAETSAASISLVGSSQRDLVLTGSADVSATANALGDRIIANAGNDTLYGGAGDDTFTEGAGTDTFVIGLGGGKDTITNFGANGLHDLIDLSAYLAAGLHPTLQAVGANTVITLDAGDAITLLNVEPSALHWTAKGLEH